MANRKTDGVMDNESVQPTNEALRLALRSAREENQSARHHADEAMQALWLLRQRRSTWFDRDEIALRNELNQYLDGFWITNSQHRLCEHYGAITFGAADGFVMAYWHDDRKIAFHITTPLCEVHRLLSAHCRDPVADMLAVAFWHNVQGEAPSTARTADGETR